MSKFGQNVKIAPPPQRPLPNKEILWGSQEGGCNHFPIDKTIIWNRKNSNNPEPLLDFWKAVMDSVERVWIVDEYLLKPDIKSNEPEKQVKQKIINRIDTILKWLHPLLLQMTYAY